MRELPHHLMNAFVHIGNHIIYLSDCQDNYSGRFHTKTQRKRRTQRGIRGFLSVILSWNY